MAQDPVNYRPQDASTAAIARDVTYAFQVAEGYRSALPRGACDLLGARVLELGRGASLGPTLLLACHGARVTVADRFVPRWQRAYHPRFFRALLRELRRRTQELDPSPLLTLLSAGGWAPEAIELHPHGIEELAFEAECFDIVLSNAVLEHAQDPGKGLERVARATRPGGLGVHQIDFRDHRDFEQPLEYLTLDPTRFEALFAQSHGECGNRWRHTHFLEAFERAGFEVLEFVPNVFADADYQKGLRSRLHEDWKGLSEEELHVLSGRVLVRRRREVGSEYPTEDGDPQSLAQSRARYAFVAPFVARKAVLDIGCAAGLGSRLLLEAGARSVTGVDRSETALAMARGRLAARHPLVRADVNRPLPFPDASFEVVVALEVLEHIEEQARLVGEIERVLGPNGRAFVSVPHAPFERCWEALNEEANPFHHRVPELSELRELLRRFPRVRFFAQTDFAASFVLPLASEDPRSEGEKVPGEILLPAHAELSDRGTVVIIAECRKGGDAAAAFTRPWGAAYGNYWDTLGSALQHGRNLERDLAEARLATFRAENRLRWRDVSDRPTRVDLLARRVALGRARVKQRLRPLVRGVRRFGQVLRPSR